MTERILPPVKEHLEDFDELEDMIRKIFRDEIYLPLAKILRARLVIANEKLTDLRQALRDNRITFTRGRFQGSFSSRISKELRSYGARFDGSTFRIPLQELPRDIQDEIRASEFRFEQSVERINTHLRQLLPEEIADRLKAENFFDSVLRKVDKRIGRNLSRIIVNPELSRDARKLIAREYTQNLRKYIQDFSAQEIVKLRGFVGEKVTAGARYEGLMHVIQKRYDVSQNKAKFLARQETGLLMAKFQQARYRDVGVNQYIWKCVAGSPLHPVRPMHKRLDGKRFSWDNPPITDEKGNRNNPGEDYNCRCSASPVVTF